MPDRAQLAGELVTCRSMELATMPIDQHEPNPSSITWVLAVAGACMAAGRERRLDVKRDLVVLAGARILAWLEGFPDPA